MKRWSSSFSLLISLGTGPLATASGLPHVTTTLYINKHFEVRSHDQPVKYVFNGDTRVARITGSLSSAPRIQRLRLRAGWNLLSLAVTASDLLGQLQATTEVVYRWEPSGDYARVRVGDGVAAGTVLWLNAPTTSVVAIRGHYVEPNTPTVPAGGAYLPGTGLEVWPLQLPRGVTVWKYDAAEGVWQTGFAGDLAPLSNLPPELAPGEAIYVHSGEAVELSIPDAARQVAYYHQDHLGSSSVITDRDGYLAEETAYYPFGGTRHQFRPAPVDTHYAFTQKERDRESRLDYFEARYFSSPLSRFISYDPKVRELEALDAGELRNVLSQPARLNPFIYALNNPVRYVDPDGRDVRRKPTETPAKPPEPELTIRIGESPKRPGEIAARAISPEGQRDATAAGRDRKRDQERLLDMVITRQMDKQSAELFRKALKGEAIKSVRVIQIVPRGDGTFTEIQIDLKNVHIAGATRAGGETTDPAETFSFSAGALKWSVDGVTLFEVERPPPPLSPSEQETAGRQR